MKKDKIAELKKEMWLRYVLARIFSQDPNPDKFEYVPPKYEEAEVIPKLEKSVQPVRFKALREKLEQAEKSKELTQDVGEQGLSSGTD